MKVQYLFELTLAQRKTKDNVYSLPQYWDVPDPDLHFPQTL